jgi:hypothetical protein
VSGEAERARTLAQVRDALRDLVADGVDFVPRAPRATPVRATASAPAPSLPTSFRPRVAPLAPTTGEPSTTRADGPVEVHAIAGGHAMPESPVHTRPCQAAS